MGVVVPAAGSGRRMGGAPKQFRPLGGAPVLVQTLRAFARHPEVGPLVVVAPADAVGRARSHLDAHGVAATVVAGGATRQTSVRAGLAALPAHVDLVLVHDAVRPFVSAALVSRVVEAARASGAAAPAVPVADTLRRGEGGTFGATVPRDGLWAMQTPQAARRDTLEAAYSEADGLVATDEVGVLERAGVAVTIVEGDARNVKLTRREDWALALALWADWSGA